LVGGLSSLRTDASAPPTVVVPVVLLRSPWVSGS